MNVEEVERYLKAAPLNFSQRESDRIAAGLKGLKNDAVALGEESIAKFIWCLETVLSIQDQYINAYQQMTTGQYYGAWCDLERTEIAIGNLHPHFRGNFGEFHISFIENQVPKFQSLFPYHIFLSPEFLYRKRCSICGALISPRTSCGHTPGEIYSGEMCMRMMCDIQTLGISIVRTPFQKYRVIFLSDSATGKMTDHYNYSLVKYVIDRLQSPFHGWDVERTKIRHPHEFFKDVAKNDDCPCGSGTKYKDCCLKEEGVLRPHFRFRFSVAPPSGTSGIEYSY